MLAARRFPWQWTPDARPERNGDQLPPDLRAAFFISDPRTRQGKRAITMKKPAARPDGLVVPRGESCDYCLGAYAEHQPFTLTALPGNNWQGPQAAPAAP